MSNYTRPFLPVIFSILAHIFFKNKENMLPLYSQGHIFKSFMTNVFVIVIMAHILHTHASSSLEVETKFQTTSSSKYLDHATTWESLTINIFTNNMATNWFCFDKMESQESGPFFQVICS